MPGELGWPCSAHTTPPHAGGSPQPLSYLLGWGAEVSVSSCRAAGCPRPAARLPL